MRGSCQYHLHTYIYIYVHTHTMCLYVYILHNHVYIYRSYMHIYIYIFVKVSIFIYLLYIYIYMCVFGENMTNMMVDRLIFSKDKVQTALELRKGRCLVIQPDVSIVKARDDKGTLLR